MKQFIPLLLLLIFTCGCRKEIEFTGEITEPKLVVNCILVSGKNPVINVSRSAPVASNLAPQYIEGATVRFYEGNEFIGYATESEFEIGTYHILHEVIEGRTYRLEVESANLKSVYAETKVPVASAGYIGALTEDSPPVNPDFEAYSNALDFIVQDPASDNYYLFYLYELQFDLAQNSLSYYSNEPIFEDQQDTYNNGGLFSDESFNGNNFTLDVNFPHENQTDIVEYYAALRTLNLDLFRFMQSVRVDDGGILTEPVQIYSNIENGIGIFGASSERVYLLP